MVEYKTGNIFKSKCKIIAHAVNCQGRMDTGLSLYVKNMYPHVYLKYLDLIEESKRYGMSPYSLTQFVPLDFKHKDIKLGEISYRGKYIANLFMSNVDEEGNSTSDFKTIQSCLEKIHRQTILKNGLRKASVAFPYKIGVFPDCTEWKDIEQMINKIFHDRKVEIWIPE